MRSSKKKRSKGTIAILIGAILVVQVAIFFVIRDPKPEPEGAESVSATEGKETVALAPVEVEGSKADVDIETGTAEPTPLPTKAAVAEVEGEEAPTPEPEWAAEAETTPEPVETTAAPPKTKVVASRVRSNKRGRRVSKPEPKPAPKPAPIAEPVTAAPTMASITILTSPSGATVALDGVFVGKSPLRNIDVAPGRHSVALSYTGFDPKVVRLRAVAGESEKISETLSKTVVARKAAPVPKPPAAVVAKRLPATPRVAASKEGNAATGKGLLASGCNSCHRKSGASSIGPRRLTSAQWDRFFSRGSHDRYQRIGGAMSSRQMAHVKTYLKSKAADAARNQGAGIR